MKTSLIFFILLAISCFAQSSDYNGIDSYFFFEHHASSSAAASGNLYKAESYDAFSSIYNPALPASINSIRLSYSNSKKLYWNDNAYFNNIGIDIPLKNIGSISFARRYFNFGMDVPLTTTLDPAVSDFTIRPEVVSYNLNFARELFSNFSAGFGFNYLTRYYDKEFNYYSFNFGAAYKTDLFAYKNFNSAFRGSIAFMNLISIKPADNYNLNLPGNTSLTISLPALPKINSINAGVNSSLYLNNASELFSEIQGSFDAGYSWLFNSPKYQTISAAVELNFFHMAALRTGYYKYQPYGLPQEEFTYGFGLQLPLYKLTTIPLSFSFDYCSRKSLPYIITGPKQRYESFSVNIAYNLK